MTNPRTSSNFLGAVVKACALAIAASLIWNGGVADDDEEINDIPGRIENGPHGGCVTLGLDRTNPEMVGLFVDLLGPSLGCDVSVVAAGCLSVVSAISMMIVAIEMREKT